MQQADIFGKQHALHAERAADLAGQDVDRLGVDTEAIGDLRAHAADALRTDIKRKAAAVISRDRGARLHRVHHHAAVQKLQARDMRGRGEGGIDRGGVAEMIVERNVAGHVVVKQRSALARRVFGRYDGGERIDVDLDRFGGVLRGKDGLGDDAGDRIADIAHLVFRQRAAPRLFHRRAVAAFERHIAFERAVALKIGGGIDRKHARHFPGRVGVDGADHAMAVAAAHHHRIGLAGQADVVGIAALRRAAASDLRCAAPTGPTANFSIANCPVVNPSSAGVRQADANSCDRAIPRKDLQSAA